MDDGSHNMSSTPDAPAAPSIHFALNGARIEITARSDERLLDILRERFGLTGAKIACGIGRCGACTVLLNGQAVNACLVLAYRLDGAEIVTAEGLDALPEGRAAREGLAAENAFQCGYCAPGITVALAALLKRNPAADDPAIRDALAGNLCRCSGYLSIVRGALHAAALLKPA